MANILNKVTDKIHWLHPKESQSIPDDLRIENAGIKFDPIHHEMETIWLKTIEHESGQEKDHHDHSQNWTAQTFQNFFHH